MRGTFVMYVLIWTTLLGAGVLGQCSNIGGPSYVWPEVNRTYYIYSPNYPKDYPSYSNCQWRILAPTGSNVHLLIVDFELEYQEDCLFDSLEVFDGPMLPDNLIAKLCGNGSANTLLKSSENVMNIKFKSDSITARKGFQLIYSVFEKPPTTTPPRTTTTVDNRIIETRYDACVSKTSPMVISMYDNDLQYLDSPWNPYYYTQSNQCEWKLIAPGNSVIVINIISVAVEVSTDCNVLQIYDGDSIYSPLLYSFCNGGVGGSISSTGNIVFVKFTSDGVFTTKFEISYKATKIQPHDVPSTTIADNAVLSAVIGGGLASIIIICIILFLIFKLLKRRSTYTVARGNVRSANNPVNNNPINSSPVNNNPICNISMYVPRRTIISAPSAYCNSAFSTTADLPSTSLSLTNQRVASASLCSAGNQDRSDPCLTDLTLEAVILPPSYSEVLLAAFGNDVVPPFETGDPPPSYSESILTFVDGANKDA